MKRLLYFALIFFPLVFHAEKSSAQLNVFIEKAISTFSRITGSTGYDTTYITDGKAIEGAEYGNPSTGNISLIYQDTQPTDNAAEDIPQDNSSQTYTSEDTDMTDRPAVRNTNKTARDKNTNVKTDNTDNNNKSNNG